jgi:hypothetical protein
MRSKCARQFGNRARSSSNCVPRRKHQKKCASAAVKCSKKYSRPASIPSAIVKHSTSPLDANFRTLCSEPGASQTLAAAFHAAEQRVDAGRAPGHDREGLQLLPGIGRKQPRGGEAARDPELDRDVLGQRLAVHDQQRHLVLGSKPQVVGRVLLALAQVYRTVSESIVLLASLDRHGRPRGTIAMVLFTRANVRSSGALAPTGPDYTVF